MAVLSRLDWDSRVSQPTRLQQEDYEVPTRLHLDTQEQERDRAIDFKYPQKLIIPTFRMSGDGGEVK